VFCAASLSRIPTVADDLSELVIIKTELAAVKHQVNILVDSLSHISTVGGSLPSVTTTESSKAAVVVASSKSSSEQSATYSAAVKVVQDKESSESVTTVNDLPLVHTEHSDHDDGFQMVTNKRHSKRNRSITGCRPVTEQNSFQGVRKKAVVCVSRLDPNTSIEAVTKFLMSNGIAVNPCYSVSPHVADANSEATNADDIQAKKSTHHYIMMRVCVHHSDLTLIPATGG